MQLPAGATLERADKLVRQASEMIMATPGVEHAVSFVGFDGATFTNAPNTGVIFVTLKPFEQRRDLPMAKILGDLRGKMFSLREAFVFVLEPPSVPGIGTGGGLKGYVQDRAARGLPALEGATWALAGAAGPDAGPHPGLHAVQHAHAADLGRDRPHQGRAARRADRARVRDAVGLHGLGLRQRLQHPRPHLSRDGAGRRSLSPHRARRRQPQDAQRQRRDGADRLGRHLLRHDRPLSRGALQPLSRGRDAGRPEARLLVGPGHRGHGRPGRQGSALGLRLRMDRDRAAGEARRRHRRSWRSAWPWSSCSCCWRRSTRAGCCRSRSS